jgi:hypothetical protein
MICRLLSLHRPRSGYPAAGNIKTIVEAFLKGIDTIAKAHKSNDDIPQHLVLPNVKPDCEW